MHGRRQRLEEPGEREAVTQKFWNERIDLHAHGLVVLNSSGGKDSQAMLDYVCRLADSQGYPRSRLHVVHCDLGRMEWPGTAKLAEQQAQAYGLAFHRVSRTQGDLLEHVRQRGMWPSSTTRYCTSDHKRDQAAKVIRRLARETGAQSVLSCMGFRAAESPARAKRPVLQLDKRLSTKSRQVFTWLPIFAWTEKQVWRTIFQSGVPHHPAYDAGMPRLSCIFCIFAPRPALILAGRLNPALLNEYVQVEAEINHSFRQDLTLAEIKQAVEAGEEPGRMNELWNM